jgi:hypothetical protein
MADKIQNSKDVMDISPLSANGSAATLTPSDSRTEDATVASLFRYYTAMDGAVEQYLIENPRLIPALQNSARPVREFFGDALVTLDVIEDPNFPAETALYAEIQTGAEIDAALDTLSDFSATCNRQTHPEIQGIVFNIRAHVVRP